MKLRILSLAALLVVASLAGAQAGRSVENHGQTFVAPGTTFTLDARDLVTDVDQILYRVNYGAEQVYADALIFEEEGAYTVLWYAKDALGNQSAPQVFSFIVDATAPELRWSVRGAFHEAQEATFIRSTSGVLIRASDLGAGTEGIFISLDGENYVTFNEEAFINEEGAKTASIYAVDRLGNKSEVVELALVVDNTPPSVSIVPLDQLVTIRAARYSRPGNSFIVRSEDQDAGVAVVEVSVDRQEWVRYREPITIDQNGSHSIRVRATDNLGNVSPVTELAFVVDGTPPTQSIQKVPAVEAPVTPEVVEPVASEPVVRPAGTSPAEAPAAAQ